MLRMKVLDEYGMYLQDLKVKQQIKESILD